MIGKTISHYKIMEKLGEGGMGEVWLAEQTKPVHRRVALKIIKLGMDTKQVMARLEAETLERCSELLDGAPVRVKSLDPRLRAQVHGISFGA